MHGILWAKPHKLVLALALFLSAGSLNFSQAWVYLAVFAPCTTLIIVYLGKNDHQLLAGRVQLDFRCNVGALKAIIKSGVEHNLAKAKRGGR